MLLDRYAQNSVVKCGNIEFKYTCTTLSDSKTCANNFVHGKCCALFFSVKFDFFFLFIIFMITRESFSIFMKKHVTSFHMKWFKNCCI